ncbi:MAG: endo-1,4-beta-xylanase, partial [Bacteroidales bacterium]|nr:endo-1,4-beta-xylanase [Bacteroidales bacterium]
EITIDANQDGAQVIAFNLCKGAPNPDENAPKDPGPVTENRYYFDDIQVNVSGVNVEVIEAQKIPLTAEEKRDTLIWAMNNWIEGMMSAAGEYIQAWNVINEPIANEGDDGNGNYPLIHAGSSNGDAADAFFWQDNMGDLEYVRTAVEAARKSYKGEAADLKLFVNDYNLNNDADDNKKCKSLIAWIEKWEADGKTKIDGIGTELHLTCYEDAATNTKKQESITKMFELLAASKKLVKVTALDIDFQDKSGKSLQVHELTDAQQQQMADLYKFVIKTYLDKVPAAQQYGICQWSVTDSGNMPKGLWTDQFRRKLTFKGFAEGLSGK